MALQLGLGLLPEWWPRIGAGDRLTDRASWPSGLRLSGAYYHGHAGAELTLADYRVGPIFHEGD
jgi:hypothetical protein